MQQWQLMQRACGGMLFLTGAASWIEKSKGQAIRPDLHSFTCG